MQERSTPFDYEVPEKGSIVDTALRHRAENPNAPLFKRRSGGNWTDVSTKTFVDDVDAVAKGLIARGINRGDRVAILSSTRYEWTVLDYAIWRAGACTVAIYETSSSDQVQWILENSGTVLLLIESDKQRSEHGAVIDGAPELKEALVIDSGAVDELIAAGKDVPDADLYDRQAAALSSDPATLIYTSGTTGKPKGVVLTHGNFLAEVASVRESLGEFLQPGNSTLLFLPLAHVFARAVAVASIDAQVVLGHTSDIPNLLDDFAKFRPSYILSVPRVFEKVYNSAKQKAHDGGKGKIFDAAADVAIEWSKAQETGGAGLVLNLKHTIFDKLVYSKLKDALGGRCENAVSGGAPLGARLGHFFRGVGVPVFEGYGLTETTAAVTVNTPDAQRVGTVGRPIPGHAVRIADDGEVLLRGPVVFNGYWHNEEATAEALQDGWFHTGDIGKLEDGFLSITGRKKELIVTAGGKNVSPAQLEDTIRAHPLVSQALVVGDNRPFIAALLTLDPESVPGWLERNDLPASTSLEELTSNDKLLAELNEAIDAANATVSHAEAIKKFHVLAADFTIESGELTPTMKLKRNVISDQRGDKIEALYKK